jgi:hypothetical protein
MLEARPTNPPFAGSQRVECRPKSCNFTLTRTRKRGNETKRVRCAEVTGTNGQVGVGGCVYGSSGLVFAAVAAQVESLIHKTHCGPAVVLTAGCAALERSITYASCAAVKTKSRLPSPLNCFDATGLLNRNSSRFSIFAKS